MLTYLDNNATTRVAPEVLAAMRPFLEDEYFNPSSAYESARSASDAVRTARQAVAEALGGVAANEVLFTSCATESLNAALFGAVRANPARRHVVTSAVEHPAVLEVCKDLARDGLEVEFLPVDRAGRSPRRWAAWRRTRSSSPRARPRASTRRSSAPCAPTPRGGTS